MHIGIASDAPRRVASIARSRELYGALCTPRAVHFEPRALSD